MAAFDGTLLPPWKFPFPEGADCSDGADRKDPVSVQLWSQQAPVELLAGELRRPIPGIVAVFSAVPRRHL